MALAAAMAQGVRPPCSRLLLGAALTRVLGYLALPYWPEAKAWVDIRNDSFWLGGGRRALRRPGAVTRLAAATSSR
jgi:hypothetical protein